MPKTVNERVQKFRDRMYDKGYKNVQIWIKETKSNRYIDDEAFFKRLNKITADYEVKEKSNLYKKLLCIAQALKEVKKK